MDTPYLLVDIAAAVAQYRRIAAAFPDAPVYYAVKANPEPTLLIELVKAGCHFDVASRAEVDMGLEAGAPPATLSFGNTIKKAEDIAYAYGKGVRTFAFDSLGELEKLAEHAPGATVICRVLASSKGARWPLSRKFGCAPEMAVDLIRWAAAHGLDPAGVCFHVGSQQLDPGRWEPSIAEAAAIFARLAADGIALRLVNCGGGFPVDYQTEVAPIEKYAAAIDAAVSAHFATRPALMIEPGRYIAAPAGVLHTEVVLVSRKSYADEPRWVYLDVGRFGGLAETEDEAIQYRLTTPHDGAVTAPVVLAGPTCDSVDILYQNVNYELPLALRPGDIVQIHGTGAYTATYASVGFNGFPPLRTVCLPMVGGDADR
ncbi:ornithine decarboxylase [Actinoplanes tereljensis]|uniref:ornithine decarboxylase n=1 Tax=Paractinoplanes tereljensis TaxID=571912 RepID=A0A919NID1_9ACTN|nr:type III PLP-dependent enzyme [Actinoplanes tereljensis]GIF19028.1 ornithine decarboxylase [Actinoplanes tereljensis]